jgi:acyl-CoA synthetase (AMP-forming)/AMP-acid ligase II
VFSSRFADPVATDLLLHDYITKDWRSMPDKLAIVEGLTNTSLTYSQYSDVTDKLTGALSDVIECTASGTRTTVTLVSPNHVHFLPSMLAVLRNGGIVSPANPLYTHHEITNQVVKSGSSVVFAHSAMAETVKTAIKGLGVKMVVLLEDPDVPLPSMEDWDCPRVETLSSLVSSSTTMIDATPAAVLSRVGIHDLALLPYSSGTTGLPKGTMLSHHNISINCSQFMAPENDFLSPNSCVISPLPFFHIYGLVAGAVAQSRLQNTLVTLRSFDFMRFLELVQEHKPERAQLVPPIILGLTKHPAVDGFDMSSLKMIMSAAAPLGGEVADALEARLGVPCKQAWGMSELSPAGTVTPDDDRPSGTIGCVVGGSWSKIVDLETGENLPPGEENTGELCIKGPQVMLGYLNEPEKTAECIKNGWLHTGDIAYTNPDGMVYIVDRLKELIKFKGFQVPPAELEAVVCAFDRCADCCVIPVECPDAGEIPRAYVVKKDAALTEQEVIDYVTERVAPHKRLRGGVVFCEEIPKNASGKILRREVVRIDREGSK